ncbi:hypothetical protein [Caulobacter sp. UC70_42]|uniref:hypothetical protein n=1 Tax=Caulobacter sp. UC70_42 TaxID=3374551 RepID=UPI003756A6B3
MSVEIRQPVVGFQHNRTVDKATRDALAEFVRTKWPIGAAKCAAREWDLSLDEAKGVLAGRTSIATLDRIWKHKNGGWSVLLPVMGAVIGETADQFIEKQRDRHAELAERHRTMGRNLRANLASIGHLDL